MLAAKSYMLHVPIEISLKIRPVRDIKLLNNASKEELEQMYYTLLATKPIQHSNVGVKAVAQQVATRIRWNKPHWYRLVEDESRVKVILSSNKYNFTWEELYPIIKTALDKKYAKKRSY